MPRPKMDRMDKTHFDEETCHKLLREQLAPLYGWPTEGSQLDPRLVFYLRLVHRAGMLEKDRDLLDLGAGLSAFGPVARGLGMRVTVVDDFGGGGGVEPDTAIKARRIIEGWKNQLGIRVIEQDLVGNPLPLEKESVDVVTCFHSLEHWHHSPKGLFGEIVRVLRPRGVLILAAPNAANLRKRIYVCAGRNIFACLEEWYHDPIFRGHVREPTVSDLHQILRWNDFEIVGTYGRNFIARNSQALAFLPPKLINIMAAGSELVLRFFPTLCSDIHVIGRKRL